ncbi:MAG: hypothetical protein H6828_14715 [Planctomycetes bacterium]|nr:hypothetical protein [Planctomycetota bacterium]
MYRTDRDGLVRLLDLPANLRALRAHAQDAPLEWRVGLPPDAGARFEALRLLRLAREAAGLEEFDARLEALRRWLPPSSPRSWLRRAPRSAARACRTTPIDSRATRAQAARASLRCAPSWPSSSSCASCAAACNSWRAGTASRSPRARAGSKTLRARPERGDVQAYLAAALERLGLAQAEAAWRRARELCPRLDETPAGRRAAQLAGRR